VGRDTDRCVQRGPEQRTGGGEPGEAPVRHAQCPGDQRDDRVDHRQERHREHGPATAAGQQLLGAGPALGADPAADPAGPHALAEQPSGGVADRPAGDATGHDRRDENRRTGGAPVGGGRDERDVTGDEQADERHGIEEHRDGGGDCQDVHDPPPTAEFSTR
jgi:hypothetical protein